MKVKGLRVTFRDNDFIIELEGFFKDVVQTERIKFHRTYMYCIGDPKRELAEKAKIDEKAMNEYIELSKHIDSIANYLFNEKEFTDEKLNEYIDLIRLNFNDYIDTLSLNDTTKEYLKKNLDIKPIDKIDLKWQNDEVVYYIFSNSTTLVF